ncbi:MAG: hypothetical protein P794_09920 [Epsilonproteobacteria bacterium (ex Lamellibrachia satsuma)]|nr:MAG: hypothetical protein P794_09920 [Epsilonproteobacteria bacterium (ex Lamellibrachia satsuma)]
MSKFHKSLIASFLWLSILIFIVFYPMLISIYVFLPLFIGVMGYLLIQGIEQGRTSYIFIAIIYFINLETNLSLPFFLIIISTLLVYVLFYRSLIHFHKCKICGPLLIVLLIDMVYLGNLLAYDFIFQCSSIVLDNILLYSLIVDLLVVVIL